MLSIKFLPFYIGKMFIRKCWEKVINIIIMFSEYLLSKEKESGQRRPVKKQKQTSSKSLVTGNGFK